MLIDGIHNQQEVVEFSKDEGMLFSDVVEVVVVVTFSVAVPAVPAVVVLVLLVEFGVAGVVSPMFSGCAAAAAVVAEDVGIGVFAKSGGIKE